MAREWFNITLDTASQAKAFSRLEKQAPFAVALALTQTAKDAQTRIKKLLPEIFDQPTRWTINSTQVTPATKANLVADVGYKYQAGRYLIPQVDGGGRRDKGSERQLKGQALLPRDMQFVPGGGAQLDAYGNMRRGQLVKALSAVRGFTQVGYNANATKGRKSKGKRRKERYFLASEDNPRTKHLRPGVWQRFVFAEGSAIKPVLLFTQPAKYESRFDMEGIVAEVVREKMGDNLDAAMVRALGTAR